MKRAIFLLMILVSVNCAAQDLDLITFDDLEWSGGNYLDSAAFGTFFWNDEEPQLLIKASAEPVHTIYFYGTDSTNFYLDMRGDSLVWGGNMRMAKSAELFIKFCDNYWYSKIDSLEAVVDSLKGRVE